MQRLSHSLEDTTYQPEAPEGFQSAGGIVHEVDGMTLDYEDSQYCLTTLPQPVTEQVRRDGYSECLCTGWFKRKIMSTPGFPLPLSPPPITYELREEPGRGIGAFATEDIKAGDLIIAERPLVVQTAWSKGVPQDSRLSPEQLLRGMYANMEKEMEAVCARMEPENQQAFRSLCNSHKTDGSGPLTGISRTNGFGISVEDPEGIKYGPGGGRYTCTGAISSRLNHSCSPNANYAFNMPAFCMEIHAVRSIAKGEEITVSYAQEELDAAGRQASLDSYGFVCTCPACRNPATSDKERRAAVQNLLPKTSQGVEHAEAVLAAYEATGLQANYRYTSLLQRVAKIHRKKGNKERADALEALADRVTTALGGRNPIRRDMPDFSDIKWPANAIITPEETMSLVMTCIANPSTTVQDHFEAMMARKKGNLG